MNEYKKSIVFDDISDDKNKQIKDIELTAQHQFDPEMDKFSLTKIKNENEPDLETALIGSKKHKGFRLLTLTVVALISWQTLDSVLVAAQTRDWLALGWSGVVAGLVLMTMSVFVREFFALSRLRGRQDERVKIQAIIDANGIGKAKAVCEKLSKQKGKDLTLTVGYDKWLHALATTHNDSEVFELYEQMVVKEQDKIAKKMVRKYASEAALMVALSPLALADMLLVGWRNFRLLEKISNVYGIRLGFWSKIKLVRLILANMAFAGASEAISDIGLDLLSVNLAGRLSIRVAQGLGIGLLTARFGFKAIEVMRPLPYISDTAPKLSDMRKHLLGRLTTKQE